MTRTPFTLLWMLLVSTVAAADEGMWTLDSFPSEVVAEKYGARISLDWLDRVRSSVVRLDGGCTGSFASPNGLVLTNNHCVWSCIRDLSSPERNLSETGFLAKSLDEELVCPGMRISVLSETEEITSRIEEATRGLSDTEANETRKAELSRLEKACEEESASSLRCESVSLYHGGQYFLYKYRRFGDVRLAFAPELPIAAFGGDPDNFNFPRWCLDVSLLRVYEDGKPASIESYFPWRRSGPEPGEAVFVAGHPGSTQRLETVAQLEHLRASTLPQRLLIFSELRGRLLEWSRTGDEPARIVQQRILGYENAIKVWRNQLASLMDETQMARKRETEAETREAVRGAPELAKRYGTAWEDVERALESFTSFEDRYRFLEGGYGFRGSLFDYARTLVRAAAERPKPSEARLRELRDTALPAVEQQLLADVPIHEGYEKLVLSFSLDKLREWLGPDDPTVRSLLGMESPDALAGRLVRGTRLDEAAFRRELWEGGEAAVAATDDPLVVLARRVDAEARAVRERYEDEVEAVLDAASEKIAQARFALGGSRVYPDATFTLRVTYGTVAGWEEKGVDVPPFTRVARLYERATGDDPFRLPQSWVKAKASLDPDMLFNLVATTDIIGGNSGSPMIDEKGQLVGLVFDGNINSIAGAFWFDIEKNRTVAVHPAILLAALERIYGAGHLVNELTLAR